MSYKNTVTRRRNREHTSSNGFTLIELLVVIAIISILSAILFPVFARARENARRASCLSNTKQIGLALVQYTQDYDEKLPLYRYGYDTSLPYSQRYAWHVALLPYYKDLRMMLCPSAQKIKDCDIAAVDMHGLSGNYGYNYSYLGGGDKLVGLSQIQIPSETVFVTEITGAVHGAATYAPSDWRGTTSISCLGGAVSRKENTATWHFGGTNTLFTDGHTKWMKLSSLADYNSNGKNDNGYFCLSKDIGASECWGS